MNISRTVYQVNHSPNGKPVPNKETSNPSRVIPSGTQSAHHPTLPILGTQTLPIFCLTIQRTCYKPVNHSKLSWVPHGSGDKIA